MSYNSAPLSRHVLGAGDYTYKYVRGVMQISSKFSYTRFVGLYGYRIMARAHL